MKNEENGLSYDASYSVQRVFRATGNDFGSIFHLLIKHVRKEREMTEKLTNTHKLESSKNLLLICSLIIFFLHISLLSYFNSTCHGLVYFFKMTVLILPKILLCSWSATLIVLTTHVRAEDPREAE